MLFSGLSPEEICNRWRDMNIWDSASLRPIKDYISSKDLTALGCTEGMIDKVLPALGIDIDTIRNAQGMTQVYNVLDYGAKQVRQIPHEEIDAEMLVAGMSLPAVLPPLERDGTFYLDSGFVQDANLMECVRRGCEELWLLWGMGNTNNYPGGLLNLYIHMLEMSANGKLNLEIQQIIDINERIANGETVWGHTKPIRLHIIKHEYPLPLDPELYINAVDAATLIDMGYADASACLASGNDGSQIELNMTAQPTPAPGVTFRETMKGGFTLGETDPKTGAKKGAKTPLAMDATISIHDLDRFASDPEHSGGITGRVSWSGFGENIPAKKGVFNLFSPTDDPELKLMVYELGFSHAGQDYYLAGQKDVKDDPGFDLWSDTTTLYVKLHRGLDKSGEVVGAGVLRLGILDLAALVRTFHPTNATSAAQGLKLVAKFGRFFLGELYDSYIKLNKS